jgi:transcription antitermination factor NusG
MAGNGGEEATFRIRLGQGAHFQVFALCGAVAGKYRGFTMGRKNKRIGDDRAEMDPPVTSADGVLDLGSWFILRMASTDTLMVARALADHGFGVWTPIENKFGRMPRTKARFEKEAALMPSYVFARVEHLDDILSLAMLPRKECGRFSVFHHKGGIPLIASDQLLALRDEECRLTSVFERSRRKGIKGPTFARGQSVHLSEGPFAGLDGVVEGSQGQFTLVSVEGFHKPIKIASLLLCEGMLAAGLSDAA